MMQTDATGPINIGNPEELSILDLARRIKYLAGSVSAIDFVPSPVDDPTRRQPDISLALDTLGWAPTIDLNDGLNRTIEWYRQRRAMRANNPVLEVDYSDSKG